MPNVSLTNYDAQLAAAQRRQKLAESLQEQADAPIDIQSYKGVQAAIPWTAVLAKALQGYAAGYQGNKASKEKESAEQNARQQGFSDYRAAAANRLTANGEAFTPAGSNVPNPQFSAKKPSMLANLLGGGNAQPPQAGAMPPQAAPMQQGAPMAAPPIVPVSQAPLPAANPAGGANMPQMAQAMPVAPPGPVGPIRKAVDFQSKAPTARELEDSSLGMISSSNPYARALGQNLFERSQTQLDEQRKLDLTDVTRDKEVARMKKMFGGEAPAGTSQQAWNAALASGSADKIATIAQNAYDNAHTAAKDERTTDMKNYDFLVSNDGYKGTFGQFVIEEANRKTPRNTTNVNINNKGEGAYVENFSKGLADQDLAIVSAGRAAPNVINSINNIRSVLDKNPITGTGANALLLIAKTINPKNPSVADTQELMSSLANQTLSNVKTSGLGSGQGFTEKDKIFLQEAKSGRITYTPESIRRIANLSEKAARLSIDDGNKVIDRIQKSPSFVGATSNFGRIEAPPSYVSPTAKNNRPALSSFRRPS